MNMIAMKKKFLGVTAVCAGALMMTMAGCSSNKNLPKVDLAGEWNIECRKYALYRYGSGG